MVSLFFKNFISKKRRFSFLWLSFAFFFTVSCGSLETRFHHQRNSILEKKFVSKLKKQAQIKKKGSRSHIPYYFNAQVQRWIAYYQGRGRPHMKRYLSRSSRYLPMMRQELRKKNLPEDLVYIVFIESGFNSSAHSRANAVGYWQFIRQTARAYGLQVNGYIDERRDPLLSTRAAIRYFEKLYYLFGDWYLAMAAYNTGENRVKRMIAYHKTRNFWKLCQKRRNGFWRETRNYVPKFLATRLIAENPEKFGFENISYEPKLEYKSYFVTRPLSFKKLSKELGVSKKELHRLNPKFKTSYALPFYKTGGNRTYLRLPLGSPEVTKEIVKRSLAKGPYKPSRSYLYYRVRRGDSLSEIAEKFRVPYSKLVRLNSIRRPSYLRIGQVLKVPKRYPLASYRKKKRGHVMKHRMARVFSSKKSFKKRNSSSRYHTVRRGENLTLIAEKYNVSVRKLAQTNDLRNPSYIHTGKKLIIPD